MLDHVERPPVGGDRVEAELAGQGRSSRRCESVAGREDDEAALLPQAVVVRRLGERRAAGRRGRGPRRAPSEVTAGIPNAPAIRFDARRRPSAEIFLTVVVPPLRAAAYRTSPDGDCTDVASPGQGPTAHAAPAAPSAAAIVTTATIERDTRISASLGRHRRYTGSGRSVPPPLQPAADPATIAPCADDESVVFCGTERIAVFYVWETEGEGGLAVKFSRLSGAALAVAALVAAMVASAAYGISTAGVQAASSTSRAASAAAAPTRARAVVRYGRAERRWRSPTTRAACSWSRPSDDAVAVFQRDRVTGALEQLKMDRATTRAAARRKADDPPCLPRPRAERRERRRLGRRQRLHRLHRQQRRGHADQGRAVGQVEGARQQRLQPAVLPQHACHRRLCVAPTAWAVLTSITAFGSYVYVGGPGRIAAFHRGTKGALKQLSDEAGCIGTGTGCTGGPRLRHHRGHDGLARRQDAVRRRRLRRAGVPAERRAPARSRSSPARPSSNVLRAGRRRGRPAGDPTSVYVAGSNNVVGVFARNKSTGALTQLAGTDGCVSAGGGACTSAPRLASIGALSRLVRVQDEPVRLRRRGQRGRCLRADEERRPLRCPGSARRSGGLRHRDGRRRPVPRGQGHRRSDGHPLHRRRQAHLRLRHDLRLGRDASTRAASPLSLRSGVRPLRAGVRRIPFSARPASCGRDPRRSRRASAGSAGSSGRRSPPAAPRSARAPPRAAGPGCSRASR